MFFLILLDSVSMLLSVARALDKVRQITNWNLERKVQRCKHDSKEDPPTTSASDECERARSNGQVSSHFDVTIRGLEIGAGETSKGADKCEENEYEGNVSPNRADEIDEAHDTHSDEEKGERRVEADGVQTQSWISWVERVGAICVVEWLKSRSEAKPESTEASKDDERECVTNEELANGTKNHEQSTEKEVRSCSCGAYCRSSGASPAHQIT